MHPKSWSTTVHGGCQIGRDPKRCTWRAMNIQPEAGSWQLHPSIILNLNLFSSRQIMYSVYNSYTIDHRRITSREFTGSQLLLQTLFYFTSIKPSVETPICFWCYTFPLVQVSHLNAKIYTTVCGTPYRSRRIFCLKQSLPKCPTGLQICCYQPQDWHFLFFDFCRKIDSWTRRLLPTWRRSTPFSGRTAMVS